jgi:hypothetical protein
LYTIFEGDDLTNCRYLRILPDMEWFYNYGFLCEPLPTEDLVLVAKDFQGVYR